MRVDLFDFNLPQELIALRPAVPRDASRMLVVGGDGACRDAVSHELPNWLRPGDALVFNDTKVIPAQLYGTRWRDGTSAQISATLHMRLSSSNWAAFVKGAKKLRIDEEIDFGGALSAVVLEKKPGGEVVLAFNKSDHDLDEALVACGQVPLPPYIAAKRPADERDQADYQTIYADERGAVAAPTAGLHFTDQLLSRLSDEGISQHYVTLHVGAGTFLPVKAEETEDHKMHSEWGRVSRETAEALNKVKQDGGRIVSVGTTSLRLLESAANEDGTLSEFSGPTDIFITPGYRFKAVGILMTNFHLPKSTLFMLVSAFMGLETMQAAYAHAIEKGYRFYSYGDSSLLFSQSAGV